MQKTIILCLLSSAFYFNGFAGDFFQKGLKILEKEAPPAQSETVTQEIRLPVESTPETWQTHTTQAGFAIQLPEGWQILQDDENTFSARSKTQPGTALSVAVNDYGEGFPVTESLKAYRQTAVEETAAGKIEAHENIQLGQAEGVLRIENKSDPDYPRRITLQAYAGTRGINVVASALGKHFEEVRATLSQTARSIKF